MHCPLSELFGPRFTVPPSRGLVALKKNRGKLQDGLVRVVLYTSSVSLDIVLRQKFAATMLMDSVHSTLRGLQVTGICARMTLYLFCPSRPHVRVNHAVVEPRKVLRVIGQPRRLGHPVEARG